MTCTCGHTAGAHRSSDHSYGDPTPCQLMCCTCPEFIEHRPNP